jgi:cysteine sulfinate desulfinase/cysteine desulfurase-like protein
VRFSLGIENTEEQISTTLELIEKVTRESLSIVRFSPCR